MKLTEDDLYRRSSQYKHWSFTPAKLAALREKTNIQASERVKANVARQRAQRARNLDTASASESDRANTPGIENGDGAAGNGGAVGDKEVDCLTVAEEMKLVDKFCQAALDLGKFIKATSEVTVSFLGVLCDRCDAGRQGFELTQYGTGHNNSISPPLLPLQLPHDV